MPSAFRAEPLTAAHRDRIGALLRATGVFRADEVDVALSLLDEGRGPGSEVRGDEHEPRSSNPELPPADYAFLGAFTPEGELAGYACYGPTPGADRTYDLYWIATDPAHQGTGIGTFLLTEVERRLVGRHARLLVVETSSRSEYAPTRGFYGRRGYTEAARVREFYAPGDDRIIYTKRFHHSPDGRGA